MHIVLLVLKIIGAILGGLLGLLLLLVLLVLFVPVRYRIHLVSDKNVELDSCVSWLLHAVHVSIRYQENRMKYCLRIFGLPVRQDKEDKENTEKDIKNAQKSKSKESRQNRQNKKKGKNRTKLQQKEQTKKPKDSKTESVKSKAKKTELANSQTKIAEQKKKSATVPERKEPLKIESKPVSRENDLKKEKKPEKKGFHPIRKIKKFIQMIREKIAGIPLLWNKIKEKAVLLNKRKRRILEFLRDEGTKSSLRKVKQRVFEIFRYIGPRKLKGYVRFGTGDPCSTGQILGILSIGRAYFNTKVNIYPVFEEKVFQADLTARGRLRVMRFLRIGSVMYFDKEIKKFIADVKQIKEELHG